MTSKKAAFPVVGIGTSAGGVKALQSFFDHLPEGSGMAFVVIIHLDPKRSSSLSELLESHTEMKVSQVNEKTELQPDHVYVISPGKHLFIQNKKLVLEKKGKESHATIDLFFRSLAEQYREHAICILLSGTGSDGTIGLKAIKEYGGVAMVQEPSEAEYDGMLLSAIHTNLVDFILPMNELAPKILEYKKILSNVKMPMEAESLSDDESESLQDVFVRLNAETGHDFSHYKRSTVLRRLQRRMQVTGNYSISQYRQYIKKDPGELTELFKDLLISVTNFFRDPEAFKALEEEVIPHLFEDKDAEDQIRVWVTGCATGEEAYSIAIQIYEYAYQMDNPPRIKIFATDISKEALKTARKGIYPETISADISDRRLQRFFHRGNSGYRICKEIREMVLFCFHDLLGNPPFSNLDLVACRNLLIYFNSDLQSEVFKLLHYALKSEAYLFLGLSDSATESSDWFAAVNKKKGIFKSRPFSNSRVGLPKIPIWKNVSSGNRSSHTELNNKNNMQLDKLHYTLLARQYAPASIIINDNNEVLHASVGIDQFLQYSEGAPSRDLYEMLSPELKRPLKRMIFQVHQKDEVKPITANTEFKDGRYTLQLMVRPLQGPNFPDDLLQIVFKKVDLQKQSENTETEAVEADQKIGEDELVEQLENELEEVREQLQVTIEEYETSNEELRTSNEELQSMNEELQTTTEELETSKEELQSVNEELRIVNSELEEKVEELRRANNDLKNLMEATEVGVIFVDKKLQIKRYTENIKGLFNLMESDLGRPLSHITNKLVDGEFIDEVKQILKKQTMIRKHIKSEDGYWYVMRLRPYRTLEENIEGVVITFVEVTDLKEAQNSLEYRASQQEAIAELGMYATDIVELQPIMDRAVRLLTDILKVKYAGMLKLDTTDNTLLLKSGAGWPEGTVDSVSLDNTKKWETGYTLQAKEPVTVEDFQQEDRFDCSPLLSDFNIQSSMNVVIKGKKAIHGILGIYDAEKRSFTKNEENFVQTIANLLGETVERVQTKKELEEANEKLKEAVRLRDEFFSIASHELQTPVTSLKAYTDLFERRLKDIGNEEYADQITKINKRVDQLSQLIGKLLDMSRIQEKGELDLEKEVFSLDELINESIESQQSVTNHEIKLEGNPEMEVFADRFRIEQVLSNLIENAIKYSPNADHIILRCKKEDGEAVVSIVDFGIGIPEKERDKIFERFYKGEGDDKKTYPGFGIGLHISMQIIKRHGGTLRVEENDPQGSVFIFTLPLADAKHKAN